MKTVVTSHFTNIHNVEMFRESAKKSKKLINKYYNNKFSYLPVT